jgi:urease beta subunit
MTVRIDARWTFLGFEAVILENRYVKVTILPELGGKIWSIVAKERDREMLWHNPRMPPRAAHYGAPYDNWFSGGWDEVFPNDLPVTIGDTAYADHGEVWSMPASWTCTQQTDDVVSVTLTSRGVAIDTRLSKTVTLHRDAREIAISYDIANLGSRPIDVHWKLHPALPVEPGSRLHLPAGTVVIDEEFGCGEPTPGTLPAPDTGKSYFEYRIGIADGRCGVTYADGIGFGLAFDPNVLTSVWTFATFSGWRDLQTVILEPCTGWFASLERAIAEDAALRLEPGQTVQSDVTAHILVGDDAISSFTKGIGG